MGKIVKSILLAFVSLWCLGYTYSLARGIYFYLTLGTFADFSILIVSRLVELIFLLAGCASFGYLLRTRKIVEEMAILKSNKLEVLPRTKDRMMLLFSLGYFVLSILLFLVSLAFMIVLSTSFEEFNDDKSLIFMIVMPLFLLVGIVMNWDFWRTRKLRRVLKNRDITDHFGENIGD